MLIGEGTLYELGLALPDPDPSRRYTLVNIAIEQGISPDSAYAQHKTPLTRLGKHSL